MSSNEGQLIELHQFRIRVGLLIDSFIQPAWIHKIVQDIHNSSVAEIVLVVKNAADVPEKRFRLQRYWQSRSQSLYAAYGRFAEMVAQPEPNAFADRDIEPFLTCPTIKLKPSGKDEPKYLLLETVDVGDEKVA